MLAGLQPFVCGNADGPGIAAFSSVAITPRDRIHHSATPLLHVSQWMAWSCPAPAEAGRGYSTHLRRSRCSPDGTRPANHHSPVGGRWSRNTPDIGFVDAY